MSEVLKATMNVIAQEGERVRQAASNATTYAIPALIENFQNEATPNFRGEIDARNIVHDPQGLGAGTWTGETGTVSRDDVDVPPGWRRSVVFTVSGGATIEFRTLATSVNAGVHTAYALVKTTDTEVLTLRLRQNFGANTILASTTLPRAAGWTLARVQATLAAASSYRIEIGRAGAPIVGTVYKMTGATLAEGDPGEPFSGDSSISDQYAYAWEAARHGSRSLRHTRTVDLLRDREIEHQLNIVPVGLTFDQRRNYLVRRHQARNKSHGSVFRSLITLVIQSEDPSFSESNVRIVEDYSNYSFVVLINYPGTGALVTRVEQLVKDLKPAHLALTQVSWGGAFLAGINQAGDPL